MAGESGDLSLGEAIREARKRRGWPQARLAKEARFGQTWLSNVELGKRGITPRDLATIAVALGTTTDELLGLRTNVDPLTAELRGLMLSAEQERQLVGFAKVMAGETRAAAPSMTEFERVRESLLAAGVPRNVIAQAEPEARRILQASIAEHEQEAEQQARAAGPRRGAAR